MLYKTNTPLKQQYATYVYLKIPCSLHVQIITLLSADPEANCFPAEYNIVFNTTKGTMADTRQRA